MKQWLKYGVLVPLFAVCTARAQNNTSPYSIIGIGDIEKGSFDRTTGMGYAGVALSSNRYMYHANPASYSRLDAHFFDIEISTRYKGVSYAGTPITDPTQNSSSDIQFKKITMAVKPWRHWAVSVGLVPFSTANYSFYGVKSVLGSPYQPVAYYQGSGSTNQFYLANSFEINKNFSIGFQASYLFGQLQEKETLNSGVTDSILLTTRNIYLGNLYYKIGAQYQGKINKNWQVALGATASPQTRLRADYGLTVQNGNSLLLNDEFYRSNYFTLPKMYTGGVAAIYKDKFTFAADYHYEDWSKLDYKGISYALVNSNRYSVGT
ncbi:MAG TPA: hypothetical protein VG842_08105, partial [Sediminibacterium sp.]|nr:hypothetical protein [Sediminibacterium sp.]